MVAVRVPSATCRAARRAAISSPSPLRSRASLVTASRNSSTSFAQKAGRLFPDCGISRRHPVFDNHLTVDPAAAGVLDVGAQLGHEGQLEPGTSPASTSRQGPWQITACPACRTRRAFGQLHCVLARPQARRGCPRRRAPLARPYSSVRASPTICPPGSGRLVVVVEGLDRTETKRDELWCSPLRLDGLPRSVN